MQRRARRSTQPLGIFRVPNCDFYGGPADHEQLMHWLFAEGTCKVFELSSDFERPLREFRSTEEVMLQFDRTYSTGDKWHTVYLQLYVLGAGPPFTPRRVQLNPKACDGATFRYAADGLGLVQLYLGAAKGRGLNNSHTNHNSQKRAAAWASTAAAMQEARLWDFAKITAFSSRLNRKIRTLSAAKIDSRPVLPAALKLWQAGVSLLPYSHNNPPVVLRQDA